MADSRLAHKALHSFCKQRPGIGIGKELFTFLVDKAIAVLNAQSQSIQYPSNTPFPESAARPMGVSFSCKADSSQYSVTFTPKANPDGGPQAASILINALSFELNVYLKNVLMSTHTINYPQISAIFNTDNKRIELVASSSSGAWTGHNRLWQQMADLPDGTPFTAQLKRDWEVQEQAFQLLSKDEIGAKFVSSIVIPNILGMIDSFSFIGPLQLSQTGELIMISGEGQWNIGCSRREANVAFQSSSTVVPQPMTPSSEHFDNIRRTSFSVPSTSPESNYPTNTNLESGDRVLTGDIFVHLPRVFMEHRFDGIMEPSISFTDHGSLGPIYWHYDSAIASATQGQLIISLQQIWPTEFKVSLSLHAYGNAGAGIKIGCISIETTGLQFTGTVDPFEIFFKVGLDTSRSEIYFESRLGSVVAHNFEFNHWPQVLFPIDQIANFILGQVVEVLINNQAGSILNVTRFSLADFGLFRGFGTMLNLLAAVSEADGSAVTMGVSFVKELVHLGLNTPRVSSDRVLVSQ